MPRFLPSLLLLSLATPALASDRILEINQTCAVETGCFAGDTPGFPVTVSASSSYRLNSDLVVPSGVCGVQESSANDVTIDLNGFAIIGLGQPAASGSGIQLSGAKNWEVRDVTIRDFGAWASATRSLRPRSIASSA